MNWKTILKKYPKCMDAFCISKFGGDVKKLMTNGKEDRFWGALSLINDRDLYDFFDKNQIRCFILDADTQEEQYKWEIKVKARTYSSPEDEPYFQREECEILMFLDAFEILEPQLLTISK